VGESLKETIQNVRAARDSVVMVRVNKESLEKLDELVEAGIVNSRSEAAAFLIVEGTKARQGLFDRISSKIEEIRNAKQELKKLLEEDEDPSSDPAVSE
jgi:Arc/MetJ-type ribon-helix-helix transcriptional regulator